MALNELRKWLYFPYEKPILRFPIHRRLLIISGEADFVDDQTNKLFACPPSSLAMNHFDCATLKGKNKQNLLGGELDIATLDCRALFKPSVVMAVAGTVKKSGCLILLCPDLALWPLSAAMDFISYGFKQTSSLYIQRFIELLNSQPWVSFHNSKETRISDYTLLEATQSTSNTSAPFKTTDQQKAFTELQALKARNALNATITAPRGRGKSSLLGLFVSWLLKQGNNILLTSSNIDNVANILKQLPNEVCTQNENSAGKATRFELNGSVLQWVAPDDITLTSNEGAYWDLLVIDEAASLPIPSVLSLLPHHKHWLLSTTLQGYEGSGSGFTHKLIPALEKLTPTTSNITLELPIRWYQDDLLETFLASCFLFDENLSESIRGVEPSYVEQTRFSVEHMSNLSNTDVNSVMQLLAMAHYQTTPDDFMRIYDSPEIVLAVLRFENEIVAACILNKEGGTSLKNVASDIAMGKRRPRGHLGAQRLALLCANDHAPLLQYWRVNRIAVSPHLQSMGLGSKLINKIIEAAKTKKLDAVTTSYALTDKLNRFWCNNGFTIVDRGKKPNKASGETSALAMHALTNAALMLQSDLLDLQLAYTSQAPFNVLSKAVKVTLINKVLHFTDGFRNLDDALPSLTTLAQHEASLGDNNTPIFRNDLLTTLVANNTSIASLITCYKASGFKDLQVKVRNSIDVKALTYLLSEVIST